MVTPALGVSLPGDTWMGVKEDWSLGEPMLPSLLTLALPKVDQMSNHRKSASTFFSLLSRGSAGMFEDLLRVWEAPSNLRPQIF